MGGSTLSRMSPGGLRTHPLVVDAETVALQGLLLGTIGLFATVFFKSAVVFSAAVVVAVAATWSLGYVRRKRAAGWVPSPPLRAMLPTYLAATALVVYAVVVGFVHTHAYVRHTNAFVIKEQKEAQTLKAEGRKLTATDEHERQRDRLYGCGWSTLRIRRRP